MSSTIVSVKISAYATVFNSQKSIECSISKIQEIFCGMNGGFEMVIVDNYSKDRTFELLKMMSEKYENLYIYREKTNRGQGRQKAFEKSSGEYAFYFDLDDILLDSTYRILLDKYENFLKRNIIIDGICKRNIIEDIGGWAPLNAGEDYELSARALKKGYRLISIPAVKSLPYEKITGEKRTQVVWNESRYAKSFFDKNLRRIKYLSDFSLGACIRMHDLKYFSKLQKFALLTGLSLNYIKRRNPLCVDPSVSNMEFVESLRGFIDPRLFGISQDHWIAGITRHVNEYLVRRRIDYFLNLGYTYVTWMPNYVFLSHNSNSLKLVV